MPFQVSNSPMNPKNLRVHTKFFLKVNKSIFRNAIFIHVFFNCDSYQVANWSSRLLLRVRIPSVF